MIGEHSIPQCAAGKILGHYRIVEKIGAGGMGEVYRAHDEHLARDVAIKVLPPGTLTDESARKRFHKEALILSQLNHPNIATIHDFDTQQGVDFLVMEYIPGITLSEKVAGRPLAEKEVLRLGVQLAEGLAAAHDHGVVHRDLKPGNLQVTSDGRLKILDFGLAKLRLPVTDSVRTESLSETQAMAGTLPYMAPEQLLGGEIDARTDIHGAGSVLYEMATGQRPFAEVEHSQLIGAILRRPPVSPTALNRRLSPELERIIGRCLEKEPEHRDQSAGALTADLRRIELGLLPAVGPTQLQHKPAGPTGEPVSHYRVFEVTGDGMGVVCKAEGVRLEVTEKRKYATIIIALVAVAVAVGVGAYALVEHEQTLRQRALAEELFYSVKAIDLDIANLTRVVEETNDQSGAQDKEISGPPRPYGEEL